MRIVYCKDCKYYSPYNNSVFGACYLYKYSFVPMYPNDYCAHGVQKQGGNQCQTDQN